MNLPEWKYVGIIPSDSEDDTSCIEVASSMKRRIKGFQEMPIPSLEKAMSKEKLYKSISGKLSTENNRILATIGHGSYHHFTYGLCRLADSLSKDYLYIHIDHHLDSWRRMFQFAESSIKCNNFVPYILEETNASKAFFLGSNLDSILSDDCRDARKLLEEKECMFLKERIWGNFKLKHLERFLESVKTDDVYVTFDLDVMHQSEISTGYDRGRLSRKGLFKAIKAIRKQKRIIGADITGFSSDQIDLSRANYYVPGAKAWAKSMKLYEDIADLVTE